MSRPLSVASSPYLSTTNPKDSLMPHSFDDSVDALRAGADEVGQVRLLLAQLTTEEKLGLLDGDGEFWKGMLGFYEQGYNTEPIVAGQVDRLGIPGIRFADGPRGCVVGRSTSFPVAMARGATWDIELEREIGRAIGAEIRAQGGNYFGGVCINLLRHPAWGRAQETYGEDPVLLGAMGEALLRGAQEHVMGCVKHFALNSMENARFTVDVSVAGDVLREVYLPHFRQVIDAGAASVMSAYNAVNGQWAGQSPELLTTVLRQEWGFEGFVVSDFIYGLRDPIDSLRAGLDVEMPFRQQRAQVLPAALEDGSLDLADVDRACERILRMQLRFAAQVTAAVPPVSVVASAEHRSLARRTAQRSAVLLRNAPLAGTPVLPLDAAALGSVAVIGSLADLVNTGDFGSSHVRAPEVSTVVAGLRNALGEERVVVQATDALEPARLAAARCETAVVVVGYTARDEGEYVDDGNRSLIDLVFPPAEDPALVEAFEAAQRRNAGTFGSGSGGDRAELRLPREHEDLIRAVCEVNPRTVVVVVAGSAVVVDPWVDLPAAVLLSWYSGMEGGDALADVLLGLVEPGGRLPFVVPRATSHLQAFDRAAAAVEYDRWYGYRLLDRAGVAPRYPFGFGLGYAPVTLTAAQARTDADGLLVRAHLECPGPRAGSQVVQVYGTRVPSDPERPVRELLGFARVEVDAGGRAAVDVRLRTSALDTWDVGAGTWVPFAGELRLEVGTFHGDPAAIEISCAVRGPAASLPVS
ncbi:beta-glucosidase [Actinotalea sp.]|uniref:beta-glucosidase family protein n=1 Tax=Actinotalea sp. TaxID=1872145 RepID=UPI003567163D